MRIQIGCRCFEANAYTLTCEIYRYGAKGFNEIESKYIVRYSNGSHLHQIEQTKRFFNNYHVICIDSSQIFTPASRNPYQFARMCVLYKNGSELLLAIFTQMNC